jgi:hypothetical protein
MNRVRGALAVVLLLAGASRLAGQDSTAVADSSSLADSSAVGDSTAVADSLQGDSTAAPCDSAGPPTDTTSGTAPGPPFMPR